MGRVHKAAMLGCINDIECEITKDSSQINATDEAGCAPLHYAARNGYVEIITRLLDAGARVDVSDCHGSTPFHHMSVWCTRTDAAQLLINRGADLNALDANGNTPLALASSCIHKPGHQWGDFNKLARFLIEAGASVDIYSAIILDLGDRVQELLKVDPDLPARTNPSHYFPAGATPLHTCADRGRAELAKLLIEAGADIAARDSRGRTPLLLAGHQAATRRLGSADETIQLLVQQKGQLDVWEAALLGELDTLRSLLISHPSFKDAVSPGGLTPLHLAAWNGRADAVRLLIDCGAPLDPLTERAETPIQLAAIYRHAEVASLLLEAGASCDLFTAISLQNQATVTKILTDDPSTATSVNRRGRSALRLAMDAAGAQQTQNDIVRHLLEASAPIDIWTAASVGNVEEITRILSSYPDAVNRYDNVTTPLHYAASSGHLDSVRVLVDHGAALEATTGDLATPTYSALWNGQIEAAKYLVSRGANQNALDNWSATPWIAGAIA